MKYTIKYMNKQINKYDYWKKEKKLIIVPRVCSAFMLHVS